MCQCHQVPASQPPLILVHTLLLRMPIQWDCNRVSRVVSNESKPQHQQELSEPHQHDAQSSCQG